RIVAGRPPGGSRGADFATHAERRASSARAAIRAVGERSNDGVGEGLSGTMAQDKGSERAGARDVEVAVLTGIRGPGEPRELVTARAVWFPGPVVLDSRREPVVSVAR